jgi:hypothetical protein
MARHLEAPPQDETGAGTGLRRLGPRLTLRCRNGHEAHAQLRLRGGPRADYCSECGAAMRPTQYGTGPWRATFWVTCPAHSITGGSAYGVEPRRAVQPAA